MSLRSKTIVVHFFTSAEQSENMSLCNCNRSFQKIIEIFNFKIRDSIYDLIFYA